MVHDLDLYKEYYEGSNRADAQWALILSEDPATIKRLEALLKITQSEAVDKFVETSCWSDELPSLVGKRGTSGERLHMLRGAYLKQFSGPAGQTDYSLLTPLEHHLFMSVFELEKTCTNPDMKRRAEIALKNAAMIADRAKIRQRKEYEALRAKAGIESGSLSLKQSRRDKPR